MGKVQIGRQINKQKAANIQKSEKAFDIKEVIVDRIIEQPIYNKEEIYIENKYDDKEIKSIIDCIDEEVCRLQEEICKLTNNYNDLQKKDLPTYLRTFVL